MLLRSRTRAAAMLLKESFRLDTVDEGAAVPGPAFLPSSECRLTLPPLTLPPLLTVVRGGKPLATELAPPDMRPTLAPITGGLPPLVQNELDRRTPPIAAAPLIALALPRSELGLAEFK